MNADSEQSETFEEQRKKVHRHIEIFRGSFLRCNAAGMVFWTLQQIACKICGLNPYR